MRLHLADLHNIICAGSDLPHRHIRHFHATIPGQYRVIVPTGAGSSPVPDPTRPVFARPAAACCTLCRLQVQTAAAVPG